MTPAVFWPLWIMMSNQPKGDKMRREKYSPVKVLIGLGVDPDDAAKLRRISMTLHRWHELECGDGDGCVSRAGDDGEGLPFWETPGSHEPNKYNRIPDRERGAKKRLAGIMIKYPQLIAYIQGDPRGCALYILRPGDVPVGVDVNSCYSNGIAVY